MKPETESTLKTIAALDGGIDEAAFSAALAILHGMPAPTAELVSAMRIREVAKALNVSSSTVHRYASKGLLKKVYGAGRFLLGISRTSYVAFTETRRNALEREMASHSSPAAPFLSAAQRRAAERETTVRKIRWAMHLKSGATRKSRLAAVDEFLRSHPQTSIRLACEAAGINRNGYSYHRHKAKGDLGIYAARRKAIAKAINRIRPNKHSPIRIGMLHNQLKKVGSRCALSTLYGILSEMGYPRKRYAHRDHRSISTPLATTAPATGEPAQKRRGPYACTNKRRVKTLELISSLFPDKSQSVTISNIRKRLIEANSPLTTYATIRALLKKSGHRIFGEHRKRGKREVVECQSFLTTPTTLPK